MVQGGTAYMTTGSVRAARTILQPAAEAGDAIAAFALAETYDPLVLTQFIAKGGIVADVGLARNWYRKARDLGFPAASLRLERLDRLED